MKKDTLPVQFNDEEINKTESFEQYLPSTSPGYTSTGSYGTNIVLVGAMLSGIILFVFIYCFWCHKSDKKSDPHLSDYGDYPDLPPEVYTVASADHGWDVEALTGPHDGLEAGGLPPAYEVAISTKENEINRDEMGLPSYEYAVQHLSTAWR